MKYKISVVKEIEMEIESEALEKAIGISCGCFDATETIDAVYTADNHIALLEW